MISRKYQNIREVLNEIEYIADIIDIEGDYSKRFRESAEHLRVAVKYIKNHINELNKNLEISNKVK